MLPRNQEIEILQKHPADVFVIHCSYGNSNNENHFSPRIHCVYVQNIDSSFSAKFSIEKYASKNGIPFSDIPDWYDDLEIYVLDDLNEFLNSKSDCLFTYWVEQGSELILDILKTRFEELNKDNSPKKFHEIPILSRKSVQFILHSLTGIEYLNQTDLKAFVRENNNQQLFSGYLALAEENLCFNRKEYDKISLSVTTKVDFFIKKINQHAVKTRKVTNSDPALDLQTISLGRLLKQLSIGSWVLLTGIAIGLFTAGLGINEYFASRNEKSLEREIQDMNREKESSQKTHADEIIHWKDSVATLHKIIENIELRQIKTTP